MLRSLGCLFSICLLAVSLSAAADDSESRAGGSSLRIYADQIDVAPLSRITYGYDRDAVCTRGKCDDNTTVCLSSAICNGIGTGLCNYDPCTSDFTLCDDGTTICTTDGECSGIGSGLCSTDHPCGPPNELCGTKVDSLTSGAPAEQTVWEMVCDPLTPNGSDCQVGFSLPDTTISWDFSGFNLTNYPDLAPTATTVTPINASETNDAGECGFLDASFPARVLGREDKNYSDIPNTVTTLNTLDRENDVMVCDDGSLCTGNPDCNGIGDGICKSSATIWLRGVVRYDDILSPTLGAGESRLCHVTGGRTEVPLWRFANQDAAGYYMELGDPRWQHTPFSCEQIILAPGGGVPRVTTDTGFEGKQTGEVINEGLVRLPSGHQFKSLVVRGVAEYRVYGLFCSLIPDQVRTVLYLWEVPHLGTVVRIQSDKTEINETDFTHLSDLDIKHGLFPPLSVSVGAITDTTVDLSWDPGLITSHIDGYRIYWDTESGGECSTGLEDCTADYPASGNCPAGQTCCGTPGDTCTSYQFDSVTHSAQVGFSTATSATIGGLDPNTTYYFTITAASDYTDPASLVTTSYESVRYPTQIPAHPVDLPLEVSALTTGGGGVAAGAAPNGDNRPGTQLHVDPGAGSMLALSWGASCRGSDSDYSVYEGTLGNFTSHSSLACSTSGATSASITPGSGSRYYLVVPHNVSSEGSYGVDGSWNERVQAVSSCRPQLFGCP